MDTIADLLRIVDAFAATRKVSDARASTLIFGDGTRVKHLRAGGDMGVRRIQRALFWLSDNWPNGADWPADIIRPEIQSSSQGAIAAGDGARLGEASVSSLSSKDPDLLRMGQAPSADPSDREAA